MRKTCAAALTAVIVALTAAVSQAATIYVDAANNTGIEDGTLAAPYGAIQRGLDAAAAGDTVSVAPGIYNGAIVLVDQVSLVSQQGPEVTIIDGLGAWSVVNMPYVYNPRTFIDGFTIKGGTLLAFVTDRVSFWAPSFLEISNCILKEGTWGAIEAFPSAKVVVKKSVLSNTPIGIYTIWCPPAELINVTIDNVGTAVEMYQNAVQITNTAVSNVTGGVLGAGCMRGWGCGWVYGSNNNFWNYANLWLGAPADSYLTATMNADPLFIDPASGNYRLQTGSPLIDAGINVGLPYAGSAPDIGAHEYTDVMSIAVSLAESYQNVPSEAFKNVGEQRRHALQNKFAALINMLSTINDSMTGNQKRAVYQSALDKLMNDIWAKGDGFYGGNPSNDWITTREEQDRLYTKVMELSSAIGAELAKL